MRLRLNTILRAALIAAAFAATGAYAFTVTDIPAGTVTVSTDSDYNKDGVVYTASTGVLTGVDSAALTFVLNNNALSQNSGSTPIIYVSTSGATWGFNTSDDKMTGHWQGDKWVTEGYVEQSALTPHADQSGNIQLTASIRNVKPGTRLYYGDSVTEDNKLYEANGLVSTNTGNIQKVTLNKTFVTSFDYQKIGGATVTAGTWTKTYDKVSRNAISGTSVDATLAISGRTQVNGGTQSTNLSNNGGDIIVGNAGQLFLQTWGSAAISLANDIYIGSSTQGDVGTYGVIRFGNDSHETTLNNLHLIENSSIGSNATGGQAVNINGTVDGAFELTIKQGQKYHFADMNISKLTLNNATVVDFAGDVTLGSLSMAAGTNMTIKETGSLTVGAGTIKFGANGISITQDADVTLNEGTVFDLSQLTPQDGVYTLFTGAGADLSTYNYTAENNIIGVTTLGSEWTFGTNGTISFTKSASKIWTGVDGIGNWNYTEANWSGQQFEAGDGAEFNGFAEVVVNDAVVAGSIVVDEETLVYLVNSDDTPGTLSAASIDIAAESMLSTGISIDGVQSYSVGQDASWAIGADQTLGAGTNNGTIYIVEGVTVTKTGTSAASDLSGFANDGGTLSVALADATGGDANIVTMLEVDEENPSSGTFELRSGTIDYRSKLGDQTLKLDAGTRLLFGRAEGDTTHTYAGDIEVAGNANVRTHGSSQHSQVTISGDVTGEGTLTRENDGDQALNFTGTVDLGGYTNNDAQDNNVTDFQGATTLGTLTVGNKSKTKFSNANTTIGTITVNGSGTVEFANSITLSGLTSTGNHALTLNATNGAAVTIAGVAKSLYKLMTTGDIVIAEGTSLTLANNLTPVSGTVTVNGTVNISNELDLSNGKTSTGILKVGSTGVVNVSQGMWMAKTASLLLEENGTFNLAGLSIVGKADGGSLTTTTTVDQIQYSKGNTAVVIDKATVTATANATGDGTIKNKLVDTTVNAGTYAVAVENANNTIAGATVGEGGSFTMTGGTLDNGATSAGGTVTLTNVKLGTGYTEQGGEETQIAITDTTNYYMGTTDKYLTVVTGDGAASATGSSLSWGDRSNLSMANGQVITTAGSADYGTLYVAEDTDATQIAAYENYELLDTIVVNNWVGLFVNESLSGKTIHVAENAFVMGSALTPESVEMANGATTYFGSEVTTESGIVFSDAIMVSMTNTNKEGDPVKYSTGEKAIAVSADKMTMTGTADVTVSNQLVVDEIVNTTTKVLTLNNVENTLELVNMDITNSTVKVYTDLVQDTEATVSISGVLQGGEATLLANLTLKGGSTLDVNGGDTNALTLGSMLTFDFSEQQLVNLDETTIAALNQLAEGQYLDLIKAAGQTPLSYTGAQTGMNYDDLFSRVGGVEGVYTVYAHDDAFGLVKGSQVPEPTTGTLSLLALAALAARRRRK